jgi:hypothetical protein
LFRFQLKAEKKTRFNHQSNKRHLVALQTGNMISSGEAVTKTYEKSQVNRLTQFTICIDTVVILTTNFSATETSSLLHWSTTFAHTVWVPIEAFVPKADNEFINVSQFRMHTIEGSLTQARQTQWGEPS